MMRIRCPECGVEMNVAPKYGDEVVAVYCISHKSGADAHTRPVYMKPVAVGVTARPEAEPVAA